MNTYRTKDGVDRWIPGVGRTVNGVIKTEFKIENSMFELVPEAPATAPAPQPAPAAAPQAVPQAPVTNEQTANKETA